MIIPCPIALSFYFLSNAVQNIIQVWPAHHRPSICFVNVILISVKDIPNIVWEVK